MVHDARDSLIMTRALMSNETNPLKVGHIINEAPKAVRNFKQKRTIEIFHEIMKTEIELEALALPVAPGLTSHAQFIKHANVWLADIPSFLEKHVSFRFNTSKSMKFSHFSMTNEKFYIQNLNRHDILMDSALYICRSMYKLYEKKNQFLLVLYFQNVKQEMKVVNITLFFSQNIIPKHCIYL